MIIWKLLRSMGLCSRQPLNLMVYRNGWKCMRLLWFFRQERHAYISLLRLCMDKLILYVWHGRVRNQMLEMGDLRRTHRFGSSLECLLLLEFDSLLKGLSRGCNQEIIMVKFREARLLKQNMHPQLRQQSSLPSMNRIHLDILLGRLLLWFSNL